MTADLGALYARAGELYERAPEGARRELGALTDVLEDAVLAEDRSGALATIAAMRAAVAIGAAREERAA